LVLLKKVTYRYIEVEDRILMLAELDGGEPVVFWLTLRLSVRLVRELLSHLERMVPRSGLVDTGLMLACKQRDAEWRHEASEPVLYSPSLFKLLPEKVGLAYSAQHAALMFQLGDGQVTQLHMRLMELRQWLAIMYRQFQRAGWPMEVWPEWFTLSEGCRN